VSDFCCSLMGVLVGLLVGCLFTLQLMRASSLGVVAMSVGVP
jgi:hypothetical protein